MSDASRPRLAEVLDVVQAGMDSLARAQEQWAKLTATASAANGRVSITVNARGIVIETRFAPDVDELTYGEIARAVVEATQKAAGDVQAQAAELAAALQEEQAKIPKFADFVPGVPEIIDLLPTVPEVPLEPPAPERDSDDADDDGDTRRGPGVIRHEW